MSELAIFGGEPTLKGEWPKWPYSGERERELIGEVLSSDLWGGTGLGPKITELNKKFANYCDVKYGAAVHYVGATVVYVDIDPMTLNIDPAKVADAITDKTRAIIWYMLEDTPVIWIH